MTPLALGALLTAAVCEVSGTVCLRMASTGRAVWWLGTVTGYLLSFTLLAVVLAQGTPLGVAYGIWAALGVALTAVLGRVLFREPLTWVMGAGIVLIMGGVLLIEVGATR